MALNPINALITVAFLAQKFKNLLSTFTKIRSSWRVVNRAKPKAAQEQEEVMQPSQPVPPPRVQPAAPQQAAPKAAVPPQQSVAAPSQIAPVPSSAPASQAVKTPAAVTPPAKKDQRVVVELQEEVDEKKEAPRGPGR